MLTAYCSLLTASSPCNAQGAWRRQQSGTLSWLRAVHFVDANRGWAVGGRGALLKTTDGGESWKLMPRPSEDALRDVYFSSGETGWLVCDRSDYALQTKDEARSYLLKTIDGGSTWTRVAATGTDTDVRLARVVFADETRGWVFGEAGRIYTTVDGGARWTRQSVPTRHLLLGGAFLNSQQGWLVGAGATFLQTSDSGATWRAGYLEPATAATNTTTTNTTATTTTGATLSATANATRPRLASTDTSNVAAAPASPVARVSDAPASSVSARLNAVSFVDGRHGWAVGSGGQVFYTNNGGRIWRTQKSGVAADLFDVKFFDELEGWAAGAEGTLLHTTDGGARWLIVPSGTSHPLERLSFAGRTRGWAVGFGGTIIAYANAPAAPQQRPGLRSVALH